MGSKYFTDLAHELRLAGLNVVEYDGWQTRARSSGGFDPDKPWCIMWHHTASQTSPQNDADYMCHGSGDRPIANLLIARDGAVWVLAAGATNTNGKGGPFTLPSGRVVPKDSMNVHAIGIEIANNGVGEPYPQVQIDAAFRASLTVASMAFLRADEVGTHQAYAPDRKIDPATADAVQGPWKPGAVTSSGTWNLEDLRWELSERSIDNPDMPEDDEMARQLVKSGRADDSAWNAFIAWGGGKFWLSTVEALNLAVEDFGYAPIKVDKAWMEASGPVIGPNPTNNPYGVWSEAGSLSAAVVDPEPFTASG